MERAQGGRDVDCRVRRERFNLHDWLANIEERNGFRVLDDAQRCRGAISDHVSTLHFKHMAETGHVAGARATKPDVIGTTGR